MTTHTDTDALVLRVAMAMAASVGLDWDGKAKGTEYAVWGYWLPVAEAAIAAMPEATTQAAQIAALTEMLAGIKWKSADRDNMEFSATITYSQMDRIRAALKGSDQ